MKKFKKILSITLVVLLIIIGIVLVSFFKSNIYIRTTMPSGLIGSNNIVTYKTSRIFFMKYHVNDNDYEKITQERKEKAQDLLDKMVAIDPDTFTGKIGYANYDPDDLFFEINNFIYYYKKTDFSHLYRYNNITKQIEKRDFSEYTKINNDIFDNTSPLVTEVIFDLYPSLLSKIKSIGKMFYPCDLFYDQERIFFSLDDIIYEYNYQDDKFIRIANISQGYTIQDIYIK